MREAVQDEDTELADYEANFRRMFGDELMDVVIGSVDGDMCFFGLTPTNMQLERIDRLQRLIDSCRKLQTARAKVASGSS